MQPPINHESYGGEIRSGFRVKSGAICANEGVTRWAAEYCTIVKLIVKEHSLRKGNEYYMHKANIFILPVERHLTLFYVLN